MIPAIFGYLLMLGFFGLEFFARRPMRAKSLRMGGMGRATTIVLGMANTCSTLLTPLLNYLRLGRLPFGTIMAALGIALMAIGLSVRSWAMVTLGQFYTRTLRVSEGQHIVEEGPYRLIRHPGYLGTLLTWVGLPLGLSNGLSMVIVLGLIAIAYRTRIPAEEEMLVESFGDEYRLYMEHTRRLVPFIL